jgi:imidazoleglycerol-phosphate dehydratase
MSRVAQIQRKTLETDIAASIDLDGTGQSRIETGIGFFDHMLTLFAKHSCVDLDLRCQGDLHVDQHHTVEDTGIVLGTCFRDALGDKQQIRRYGYWTLPMDEALVTAAVDFGGRAYLVFNAPFSREKIGDFEVELVREFWQAFASSAGANLHVCLHYGTNNHHIAEGIFKATARAVRMAIEIDSRTQGIPSTKGVL